MSKTTRATQALEKLGVKFTLHSYDYDPDADSIGLQAAEALGVHVQTLRAYVRSGRLPALRLAGERAIRIRRSDLEKVLEPVQPESDSLHRLSGKKGE